MDKLIGYDRKKRSGDDEIRRQSALVSQMSLLQVISEHNADFVGVLNQNRQFVFINRGYFPAAENLPNMLGLRPGEAFGCVHAHDAAEGCGTGPSCSYCDAVGAVAEALVKNEKVRRAGRILVARGDRSDSLDVMLNAIPLSHWGERFIVLHIQDISNQRRMEILERIFYHDIRNTIATLGGLIYLSEIESADVPDAKNVLDAGLQDIVEQIEYQRTLRDVEAGQSMPELPAIELSALIKAFVPLVDNEIFLKKRSIEICGLPRSLYVKANPMILRRILLNLVKNAVEASQPGERVSLCVREEDGFARLTVRNPAFMDPRVQAGIFQHSFSTKGTGRGFGTYSVKLLSQRYLGGDASFTTSREEGTAFTVSLPMVAPDSGE